MDKDRYRPRTTEELEADPIPVSLLNEPVPPDNVSTLVRPKQRSLHAVLVESVRMFCASLVLFSFSASAFDLDGAWVTKDAANCSKVFWKRNNQIRMARNADTFGGGFLVDGNRIRRPFLICNIDKRTDDGDMLHLMASCSGIVDFLAPLEFDLKIEDNNKITRFFPSFPETSISYFRCKL